MVRRVLLAVVVMMIALVGAFIVLVVTTRIPAARTPLQQLIVDDFRGERIATITTGRAEERLSLAEIAPIAREAVVAGE